MWLTILLIPRAHLNDLESILPFLIIALLYCFTSPDPAMAHFLFKVFTGARIIHTLVYAVVPLPQPARGAAFFTGMGVTVFLTFKVLCHFYWSQSCKSFKTSNFIINNSIITLFQCVVWLKMSCACSITIFSSYPAILEFQHKS